MIKSTKYIARRKLKPLPKGVIGIYGLIAVLIVIIPELLAEFALFICLLNNENKMPQKSNSWQTLTELRLAAMNMRELRVLAMKLRLHGYSNQKKKDLSSRITYALKNNPLKSATK